MKATSIVRFPITGKGGSQEMASVVPSDIVRHLDKVLPTIADSDALKKRFAVDSKSQPGLIQGVAALLKELDDSVLPESPMERVKFIAARETIMSEARKSESGVTAVIDKLAGYGGQNPIAIVRELLSHCPDGPIPETTADLDDRMDPEWSGVEILLEPVQQELLITIVESARNTPIDSRQKFLVAQSFDGDALIYPTIPKEKAGIYFGDVETLAHEGLLSLGYGSKGTPNFDVTPLGFKYYEYFKKTLGEPVERIVKTVRAYLDSNNFIKVYPAAYKKWCSAEELLWETDSKQQLTLIGHLCRESIQEFADYLVSTHNLSNVPADKSKTVARLKAVIATKADSLGDSKKAFLNALVSYWGTVIDLIQRQEHDSQKEGQTLVWEDARAVVFQTLIVMFEIDRNL